MSKQPCVCGAEKAIDCCSECNDALCGDCIMVGPIDGAICEGCLRDMETINKEPNDA